MSMGEYRIMMKKNLMGILYINGSTQESIQIKRFSPPENFSVTLYIFVYSKPTVK